MCLCEHIQEPLMQGDVEYMLEYYGHEWNVFDHSTSRLRMV